MLLSGDSMVSAALKAGVTVRTVFRWLKEPGFTIELRRREGEVLQSVSRRLVSLTNKSLDTLEGVLDDTTASPGNRRLAAVAILEMVLKWRENIDFEERISQLEGQVLHEQ